MISSGNSITAVYDLVLVDVTTAIYVQRVIENTVKPLYKDGLGTPGVILREEVSL
jgi:hypothetical protein